MTLPNNFETCLLRLPPATIMLQYSVQLVLLHSFLGIITLQDGMYDWLFNVILLRSFWQPNIVHPHFISNSVVVNRILKQEMLWSCCNRSNQKLKHNFSMLCARVSSALCAWAIVSHWLSSHLMNSFTAASSSALHVLRLGPPARFLGASRLFASGSSSIWEWTCSIRAICESIYRRKRFS